MGLMLRRPVTRFHAASKVFGGLPLAFEGGRGQSAPHANEHPGALAMTSSLGAFSISLAVKDIHASRAFYEKLGFEAFAGDVEQRWLMLKNGAAVIGLFQGMFEKNLLTFNPGWDADARNLDPFVDVREWQRRLKADGLAFTSEADPGTTGPASFVVVDPDGNPVLVDQHR
jgi:catechol 2,3-dioxygenase-like lactoylglutathione lyase family enzyme